MPLFPEAAARFGPWIGGAGGHRHPLRRAGGAGAEGPQVAGRLLVGGAPGLRHAGPRGAEPAGRERRDAADGQPRRQHRRAVPHGRHALRAAAHAHAGRLRRPLEERADLLLPLPGRGHEQRRPAGAERLRRRVHHPAGRVSRGTRWFAVLAALGVILAAWYLLDAFRKMRRARSPSRRTTAATCTTCGPREVAAGAAAAAALLRHRPLPEPVPRQDQPVGGGAAREPAAPIVMEVERE